MKLIKLRAGHYYINTDHGEVHIVKKPCGDWMVGKANAYGFIRSFKRMNSARYYVKHMNGLPELLAA